MNLKMNKLHVWHKPKAAFQGEQLYTKLKHGDGSVMFWSNTLSALQGLDESVSKKNIYTKLEINM